MMSTTIRGCLHATVSLLSITLLGHTSWAGTVSLSTSRDMSLLSSDYSTGLGQQINDVNLGGSSVIQVGTAGDPGPLGETRILMSFDVASMPEYGSITGVTLRLFYNQTNSDIAGETPFTVEIHEVSTANADWTEGIGIGDGGANDNGGANWNWKDEPTNATWAGSLGLSTPSDDYDPSTLATRTFNALPAVADSAVDFTFTGTSVELTNLIDGWMTTNSGIVLFHDDPASLGNNKRLRFHSSEAASAAFHPQLIVEFSEVPEPSTGLLLGLGALGYLRGSRRRRRLAN